MDSGYKGFGARSYNGISLDQCLIGLQRGIRLGMETTAIYFSLEIAWIGSSYRKLLWHRLTQIALEDIGPANFLAIYHVVDFYENRYSDDLALVTLVTYLSQSPKSRINPLSYWKEEIFQSYDLVNKDLLEKVLNNLTSFREIDQARFLIESIWKSSAEHQENFIEKEFHPPVLTTGKRRKAPILIWRSFDKFYSEDVYYLRLRKYFLGNQPWRWYENRGRLVHAHFFHYKIAQPTLDLTPLLPHPKLLSFIARFSLGVELQLPDKSSDKITNEATEWNVVKEHYLFS